MTWPPNPNADRQPQSSQPHRPTSPEWQLIEKTMMASIEEQRRSRRWNIFFKVLTFGYVLIFVLVLGRGCVSTPSVPTGMGEPHLAVVDVRGAITPDGETSAYHINAALMEAFENEQAQAVAFVINSPGGSPVQSDEIWQMAMTLKKRVSK